MSSRNRGRDDFEEPSRDRRDRDRSRYDERSDPSRSSSTRSNRDDKRNRWSNASQSVSRFSSNPNATFEDKNALNYPTKPTAAYGTGSTVNPNILYTLNDNTKIKKKIFIPKVSGVNFVGLLIGPRGTYQKRLEQQSGCKILIRGKGTQKDGMPAQPDDNEEQHVLVVGETEENVNRAQYLIDKVIHSDDSTRNRIKEEQLKASQEMRAEQFFPGLTDANGKPIPQEIDDYLMTPYGPPDRNARILPVPNDCVGLIIGKNGETIRRLHRETGCKIQIAKKEIPNTDVRNVFIEGPPEKYEVAKRLIEEIIAEQIFLKQNFSHLGEVNPFPGPHTPLRIPNKMVGLIIGKNGETVRNIHQKTGCFIFIPKESRSGEDFRELELSGPAESVELCKREIISMIHLALYGRLPYMNSLFYPFIDPITGLPIIDPGIMAQLDPNSRIQVQDDDTFYAEEMVPDQTHYENFQQSIYEMSKGNNTTSYDVDDYNNPRNYDLYYQSLYQMYPQMSDYYKKAQDQSDQTRTNTPYVLFNTGILDPEQQENNTLYDPNFVNNLQNIPGQEAEKEVKESTFDFSKIDYNKYIDSIYANKKGGGRNQRNNHNQGHHNNNDRNNSFYDKNAVNDNVFSYYENFYDESKEGNKEPTAIPVRKQDEGFKAPFGQDDSGNRGEKKRRSRFDEGN